MDILPTMRFTGYDTLGPFGNGYPTNRFSRVFSSKANISHIWANHSFQSGFETRQFFDNMTRGGNTTGNFAFDNLYTRRNDDSFTPALSLGHSWAAFLMGLPSSMTIQSSDSYALHSPAYGWFLQDSIHATPKLTLNLGFRAEYQSGPTERFNRVVSGFDTSLVLPITAGAEAAYSKHPIPELSAADFSVLGGSLYPNSGGGRQLWSSDWMWMPRAGVAYQLGSHTVLRGGYGIYYDPLTAWNATVNQTGFSQVTSTDVTHDFGQTWLAGNPGNGISPLSDPFPVRSDGTRFDTPLRDQLGSMAVAGQALRYSWPDAVSARQHRWRVDLQHQFGADTSVTVGYAGSRADRVSVGGGFEDGINSVPNLNYLPEQYWADGMQRDNALASNLTTNVDNPLYVGNFPDLQNSNPLVYSYMESQTLFRNPKMQKQQLLRLFPQMGALNPQLAGRGKVRTHELDVSFRRRLAKGLSLNVAYTMLRNRTADVFFDEFDSEPTFREGQIGRPQRFVAASIVQLPFGKGRAMLNEGVASALLGGFQLGITYEWQPGALLNFPNLFYQGDLSKIASDDPKLDRWFNTDGFVTKSSDAPAAYHRRVFPVSVSGVRAGTTNLWNANIQREFGITEQVKLQLRVEAMNLENRSLWSSSGIGTFPLSTNFGKVVSQAPTYNRFMQFQIRLAF
ncbi:MAG: TonB-dependent receptor [Bryobacterales bacterium]|nr:TonB-dependent receptor [Bryobacterales bacterium]